MLSNKRGERLAVLILIAGLGILAFVIASAVVQNFAPCFNNDTFIVKLAEAMGADMTKFCAR